MWTVKKVPYGIHWYQYCRIAEQSIFPLTKFGLDEMKLEMLDEVDPDLGGEVAGGAAHQLPVDLRLQRHLLPLTRLEGVLQSDRGHSQSHRYSFICL
jgi:hypothetical protein